MFTSDNNLTNPWQLRNETKLVGSLAPVSATKDRKHRPSEIRKKEPNNKETLGKYYKKQNKQILGLSFYVIKVLVHSVYSIFARP
jgi:hypothetical protein